MKILADHAVLWTRPENGLVFSSKQRARLRSLLAGARDALISSDAIDLRLRQLLEAELLRKRISPATLRSFRTRIEEVEGRERSRFVSVFTKMQGVLTSVQRLVLERTLRTPLPSSRISFPSAFFFAERLLALRKGAIKGSTLPSLDQDDLVSRYQEARKRLFVLAAEKSMADRNLDDLLNRPLFDRPAFEALENADLYCSGRFWDAFFGIAALPGPRTGRDRP